ncbi:MAG: hypothetical protein IBX52_09475 [Bacterioplanes sp.]|nr:hypothetical protein [Bacterioplanes sp.]
MRIPSLLWTFCSAIVIASLVSGCSGNTSTGSNRGKEPARLNGYVGASDAYSVLIYAVPIDSQGQPTTELVESTEVYVGPRSTSTTRAFYQVNVAAAQLNRPATFIALSNSRNDSSQRCQRPAGCSFGGDPIAYNASRQLDAEDFEWRASVGTVLPDMRVNINWITHAASAFAYTSFVDEAGNNVADVPKTGIYTPFTIERANLWLSRLFDISDIISLRPLSPSELNTLPELSSSLRQQGLYYGALLAAAQELASTEGITPEQWLAKLVDKLLKTQGQLVMNDEDSAYSLVSIFKAAHTILAANRDYLAARNATIPAEVNTVIEQLKVRETGYRNGTIGPISVKDEDVNASLAPLANAKEFMKDLNDRLFNLTGKHPRTCGKEGVDSENCVPSFVDYQYVQTVDAYYQALDDDYRPLLPLLNQGLHDARDLVEGFLACVHFNRKESNPVTCDLPIGWNFDPTNNSATNGSLTLTYKGIALEKPKEGETAMFNAFDVFLNGKLVTENTLNESATLHFKPLADEDDEAADPTLARVRVVFDEATERPPLVCRKVTPQPVPNGCIEPLGFDVAWPQLLIDDFKRVGGANVPKSSLRFSFNATLIGVRDVVIGSSDAGPVVSGYTPYHYNLSAVSLTALLEGEQTGQIREEGKDKTVRNQSELLFSGRASNAANYYGQQRWPSVDDFFRVRDGFDTSDSAPVIAPGLFRYRYYENVEVLFRRQNDNNIMRTADYLEIEILGVGIERIELFKNEDGKGDLGYRKCSIVEVDDEDNPGQTKRQPNLYSDVTAVTEDDFTLSQLIADDGKLGLFAYPSRGAYKPLFSGVLTPTSTDIVIDGELKATFSIGIDRLQLRMAHELFDFADESENDSKTKRLPMALMNIDLSRTSRERWEVALLAGYDYDYVIEGFPIGIRAQSLYASYFVDMNVPFREDDGSGNVVTNVAGFEAGSLIVNRGGVTLFSDTGQSIGITIATLADYLPGDVEVGCAVMGRDRNITNDTCDARGYLTYRNALLAVIREERPNVFVIRYIDGAFQVIAPPPQ